MIGLAFFPLALCREITCKSGIFGIQQREFYVCFLVPLIARCTTIRQQFSQFIVHYKIIGIIGGSSFSRCIFFSLSLSHSISSNRSDFFVRSVFDFRIRCNQIVRNAFRISEMKELHRKLFLGDISTFE